jgi:ABC-type sugar transport system ATPase subunit
LGVRAERISVEPPEAVGAETPLAHVVVSEYLGAETVVAFKLGRRTDEPEQSAVGRRDVLQARIPGERHLTPGADCAVRLDLTNASFFDVDSGERLPVAVPEVAR